MILAVNRSKTPQSLKIDPNFDNVFQNVRFSKNGRNGFLRQFWSRKAIYLMYSYI